MLLSSSLSHIHLDCLLYSTIVLDPDGSTVNYSELARRLDHLFCMLWPHDTSSTSKHTQPQTLSPSTVASNERSSPPSSGSSQACSSDSLHLSLRPTKLSGHEAVDFGSPNGTTEAAMDSSLGSEAIELSVLRRRHCGRSCPPDSS